MKVVLNIILVISVVLLATICSRYMQFSALNLCETFKCPYCYGTDLCSEFAQNKITLYYDSVISRIISYIGVKNVFLAEYNDASVILKKLAHSVELLDLDKLVCSMNNISEDCSSIEVDSSIDYKYELERLLTSNSDPNVFQHFRACSQNVARKFIEYVTAKEKLNGVMDDDRFWKNIWTIVKVNVEPLLLQILNSDIKDWPVPKYYGACGRLIVEEYCGRSLTDSTDLNWFERAVLAQQLLKAAENFTYHHDDFRIYLTDITSDNIAVSPNLRLTFIDLEDVILAEKGNGNDITMHVSEDFHDDTGFIYSEQLICDGILSDHNVYAVCKLLLSESAPWPMMEGGLLHSPPNFIVKQYPQLFSSIQECVTNINDTGRFLIATHIQELLSKILNLYGYDVNTKAKLYKKFK